MSCGNQLHWYDLIPVFSWFSLKGKCRSCKGRISLQYPLVELITGALFALVALKYYSFIFISIPFFIIFSLFSWFTLAVLIVIAVYDFQHKIIPDQLAFIFAILGIARIGIDFGHNILSPLSLLDIIAGPLFAFTLFLVWYFSKGKWIGLGDAKLVLGIGWFLGFSGGLSAIVLGFWVGTVICLGIIFWERFGHRIGFGHKKGLKIGFGSEIPLAPFLIAGFLIVFFLNVDVLHIKDFLLLYTNEI
jgi:leader peptidase (prepilin peptidase)/N-methyltransferase